MTLTINKEDSKSKLKAPRNSIKTYLKLTKTSKRYVTYCCDIPVVKFGQVPHPMQYFYTLS